jgi:hypothetical protein
MSLAFREMLPGGGDRAVEDRGGVRQKPLYRQATDAVLEEREPSPWTRMTALSNDPCRGLTLDTAKIRCARRGKRVRHAGGYPAAE